MTAKQPNKNKRRPYMQPCHTTIETGKKNNKTKKQDLPSPPRSLGTLGNVGAASNSPLLEAGAKEQETEPSRQAGAGDPAPGDLPAGTAPSKPPMFKVPVQLQGHSSKGQHGE
jgi:hypothetical protein